MGSMPQGGQIGGGTIGRPGNALRQRFNFQFLKELWRCLNRDDAAGLSAEMTYNWMLSLVPALIFVVTLFGMFGVQSNLFEQLMGRLHAVAPGDAYNLVQASLHELTKDSNGSVAILSLLGAVWTASNGVSSAEKAMNRAFQCVAKRRGMVRHALVGIFGVLGLGVLMFVSANLIVFGDVIFGLIRQTLRLPEQVSFVFNWLRWTVAVGGLVLIISFIYWLLPDVRAAQLSFRQRVLPGTLVFVPLWLLMSWLFSVYVSNFGNYNKIYGSMGTIIVLMLWLYMTSYALIIGGEVNAIVSGCSQDKTD
jgi:membrane protein